MQSSNGILNPVWAKWINQLYLRTGGASSPDLSAIVSDIKTLQANVAVLFAGVTSLNSSVSTLTKDFINLSVGRQL